MVRDKPDGHGSDELVTAAPAGRLRQSGSLDNCCTGQQMYICKWVLAPLGKHRFAVVIFALGAEEERCGIEVLQI